MSKIPVGSIRYIKVITNFKKENFRGGVYWKGATIGGGRLLEGGRNKNFSLKNKFLGIRKYS